MLLKTSGIIIYNTRLAEKKYISKIYTSDFGLQTYTFYVGSSGKSKIKAAHIFPLNQIEFSFTKKENQEIGSINEINITYQYHELHQNIIKTCLAQFINEVIYKSIHEKEPNDNLFHFLISSLQWLDLQKENVKNFHVYFLLELSRHLGFYPQNNYTVVDNIFDLRDGEFKSIAPPHPNYLNAQSSAEFSKLLSLNINTIQNEISTIELRSRILNYLIAFYQLHIHNFKEIKSIGVLQETLQ